MFDLNGKTALVTGASQGIGAAIARRLAGQGARVVLAARSTDKLETLATEIADAGGEAYALALDVSQADAAVDQLAGLPKEWAQIDVAVANAGITRDTLIARMKLEQWEEVLRTNLTGSFATVRPLIRGMMKKRWGRIVFVSSVVGLMGNPGQANYAASKAGMIGMAKSLARELASRNITVNVVAPGFIETAMTEALDDRARDGLADQIPLGRVGGVDDISNAVLYLASNEAGYVTGQVLNVSGGLYM